MKTKVSQVVSSVRQQAGRRLADVGGLVTWTMTEPRMQHPDKAASSVFRAMADPTRRRALLLLHEKPHTVGQVADALALKQQTASHHLSVLRRAGLVTEVRDGTRHVFQLRGAGLDPVIQFLRSLHLKDA